MEALAHLSAHGRDGKVSARRSSKVAEVFRRHGDSYLAKHPVTPEQAKVLRAVMRCRTAALGGHLEVCDQCGFSRPAYNSCRDRHCPSCQAFAQHRWLEKRLKHILSTHHFHVVFTLPAELRPLARRNAKVVYDILFDAASETLDTLGRQRLGARIGATVVLHTWTRKMLFHPHVHCVVTGGGVSLDGQRWVAASKRFLFPVAQMRKLFRGIVRRRLRDAYDQGRLDLDGGCAKWADPKAFARLLRGLHRKKWVVYAKRPFAGPEQVFSYLGRYTHRVAISDHRVLSVDEGAVAFRTKNGGVETVEPHEFIRRFLLHVLPFRFHKIRHYGLYSSAHVRRLWPVARRLLGAPVPVQDDEDEFDDDEDWEALAERLVGEDHRRCPACGEGFLRRTPLPKPPVLAGPPWMDSS